MHLARAVRPSHLLSLQIKLIPIRKSESFLDNLICCRHQCKSSKVRCKKMKVCCITFSSRSSDLKFSCSNKESESELIFTKNTIIDGGSTAYKLLTLLSLLALLTLPCLQLLKQWHVCINTLFTVRELNDSMGFMSKKWEWVSGWVIPAVLKIFESISRS